MSTGSVVISLVSFLMWGICVCSLYSCQSWLELIFIDCFEEAAFCFIDFLYGVSVLSFIHQLWKSYFNTCSRAWVRNSKKGGSGKGKGGSCEDLPIPEEEGELQASFPGQKEKVLGIRHTLS